MADRRNRVYFARYVHRPEPGCGEWRKSSYSAENGGECVEAASGWRKSSYSGENGGNCVEAASSPTRFVAIRDSKDPDGPVLTVAPTEWRNFIATVKTGSYDLT